MTTTSIRSVFFCLEFGLYAHLTLSLYQHNSVMNVDYLSHDWQEEADVWASWRHTTRHKNDIANGVRLENASWRTWWKQRNNLKTVSPETLNWFV